MSPSVHQTYNSENCETDESQARGVFTLLSLSSPSPLPVALDFRFLEVFAELLVLALGCLEVMEGGGGAEKAGSAVADREALIVGD